MVSIGGCMYCLLFVRHSIHLSFYSRFVPGWYFMYYRLPPTCTDDNSGNHRLLPKRWHSYQDSRCRCYWSWVVSHLIVRLIVSFRPLKLYYVLRVRMEGVPAKAIINKDSPLKVYPLHEFIILLRCNSLWISFPSFKVLPSLNVLCNNYWPSYHKSWP